MSTFERFTLVIEPNPLELSPVTRRPKLKMSDIFGHLTNLPPMLSIFLCFVLLILDPQIAHSTYPEIRLTSVLLESPWLPRIRPSWSLLPNMTSNHDPLPLLYGGWLPRDSVWHSVSMDTTNPDCPDTWLMTLNHSWILFPVGQLLQLYIQCPGQTRIWSRGTVLLLPDGHSPDLAWLAWQTLISRALDPWERTTCLQKGRAKYHLQVSPIDEPIPSQIESISAPLGSWFLKMETPRYGALTAVQYNNSYLGGSNIYYVLGGAVPQPDGGDYYLTDLWASRDGGHSWIQIRNRFPWSESTDRLSFGISARGVLVVTVASANTRYREELWVSLDGGQHWDMCTDNSTLGDELRMGATLGFDAQGYMYVVGGGRAYSLNLDNRGNDISLNNFVPSKEVMKSNMSFDDFDAVNHRCGYLGKPEGITAGLTSWEEEDPSQRAAPERGKRIRPPVDPMRTKKMRKDKCLCLEAQEEWTWGRWWRGN